MTTEELQAEAEAADAAGREQLDVGRPAPAQEEGR